MITLALAVTLSQLSSPPLVTADTEVEAPAAHEMHGTGWLITTPIVAALGFGFYGRRIGYELTAQQVNSYDRVAPSDGQLAAALISGLIGAGAGFVAGWFAQHGYVAGKIACIALMVLSGAAPIADLGISIAEAPPSYGGGGWGW